MLFHDGRAMIADFGIALIRSGGDTGIRLTKVGVSPLQGLGQLRLGAALDPGVDASWSIAKVTA